jgi:hypothetical protein
MIQAYQTLVTAVFMMGYRKGSRTVPFRYRELSRIANALGITQPQAPAELISSILGSHPLPEAILATEPEGEEWIVRPRGRAKAEFALVSSSRIFPNPERYRMEIVDSAPPSAASDSFTTHVLMSKIRHNRLLDTFLGVSACSLRRALKQKAKHPFPGEIDDLCLGVDPFGSRYLIPVQMTRVGDPVSTVVTKRNIARCGKEFPHLACRPVSVQFTDASGIAMFELQLDGTGAVKLADERHYELVPLCGALARRQLAYDS